MYLLYCKYLKCLRAISDTLATWIYTVLELFCPVVYSMRLFTGRNVLFFVTQIIRANALLSRLCILSSISYKFVSQIIFIIFFCCRQYGFYHNQ